MGYNAPQYNKKKIKALKYSSGFDIMVRIFFATFIIIFILVVFGTLKFSAKIDIEGPNASNNAIEDAMEDFVDDEQRTIDKRLILLQQEEKAPNEAKIIVKEEGWDNNRVMDPELLKEDLEDYSRKNKEEIKQENNPKTQNDNEEELFENENKPIQTKPALKPQIKESYSNITIMSKVLIGKYLTFEEAKSKQVEIKENNPNSAPYVKKVGDIYSVQMGTYQDFATAKSMAASLKSRGYDVWIYQQ